MSENAEKAKELADKGKEKARALCERGSELMDKVPFLRGSATKKLIAVGGLALLLVILLCVIFIGGKDSGNKDDSTSLGEVTTTGNVTAEERRGAEVLNKLCKMFLERQYGKDALKSYEFRELKWNESRAILKADVSIQKNAPITDPGGDVNIVGTAVFFLEDAGDDINVVELSFQ